MVSFACPPPSYSFTIVIPPQMACICIPVSGVWMCSVLRMMTSLQGWHAVTLIFYVSVCPPHQILCYSSFLHFPLVEITIMPTVPRASKDLYPHSSPKVCTNLCPRDSNSPLPLQSWRSRSPLMLHSCLKFLPVRSSDTVLCKFMCHSIAENPNSMWDLK